MQVGEYAWIGKKRKGQDSKNRVAGGGRVPSQTILV